MKNKTELIKKKDARILFNCNREGKITNLIVAKFVGDESIDPHYLYKAFQKDFGNCNEGWEQMDDIYIFLRIWSVYNGFMDKKFEDMALKELMKIQEFNKPIIKFFNGISQ